MLAFEGWARLEQRALLFPTSPAVSLHDSQPAAICIYNTIHSHAMYLHKMLATF